MDNCKQAQQAVYTSCIKLSILSAVLLPVAIALALHPAIIEYPAVAQAFTISDDALRYAPLSSSTIAAIIRDAAERHQTAYAPVYATLYCESNTTYQGGRELDQEAIGDHGESIGLCQIHLKVHPEITRAQARDPRWCANYAAEQFAKGKQRQWSCYKILYGGEKARQ